MQKNDKSKYEENLKTMIFEIQLNINKWMLNMQRIIQRQVAAAEIQQQKDNDTAEIKEVQIDIKNYVKKNAYEDSFGDFKLENLMVQRPTTSSDVLYKYNCGNKNFISMTSRK